MNMLITALAALAILAPAAGQENPAATPVSRRPTTSILSIQGTRFLLDGKPFYFQGLSFFNALYNKEFNKSPESREKTLRRFKSYGITALRIWGDWRLTNGWIDECPDCSLYVYPEMEGRDRRFENKAFQSVCAHAGMLPELDSPAPAPMMTASVPPALRLSALCANVARNLTR